MRFDVKDTLCRPLRLGFGVAACGFLLMAQDAAADWFGDTRELMGATVSVRIWDDNAVQAERSVDAVFAEIDRIDKLMNSQIETSEVAMINREATTHPVVVNPEVFDLMLRALDISRLTRGAFDITFGSVTKPSGEDLKQAGAVSTKRDYGSRGYLQVATNTRNRTVQFQQPGTRISLGGIFGGYAVERGAEILIERGIEHAVVTVGGDTKLLGDHLGESWKIGISDPQSNEDDVASLLIDDQAVSTSGDYVRYFSEDGERVHRIIEPATGLPATGVRSATVVGPDAVITDALSTSVFIMGVSDGINLLKTLPDYEGIVIDAEGNLHYSEGLEYILRKGEPESSESQN